MVSFMIEKISIKFVQHIIQSQTCSPSTVCYAAWPPRLAGAPLWRRRRGARWSWTGWRPPSGGGTPTRTASSPGQSSNRCTVHTVQYIVYSLDSLTTVWKVKCDSMTVWQCDSVRWQSALGTNLIITFQPNIIHNIIQPQQQVTSSTLASCCYKMELMALSRHNSSTVCQYHLIMLG